MPYFSADQLDASLKAYEETTHTMLISLLAMWRVEAPLDDGHSYVKFGSEQETALLEHHFSPEGAPPSNPLFVPFYKEQGKSRWRARTYAQRSLQAQRQRLPDVFVQNAESRTHWALNANYVENALARPERSIGTPPISIPALAAWIYRDVDLADLDAAIDAFVADFHLDRDGLIGSIAAPSIFTRADTHGIGEPQQPAPLGQADLLAVLAAHSAPPASSTEATATDEVEPVASGGLVDPEASQASWQFDLSLLENIGGLEGMEEAAFSATAALRAGDHVIFIGPPGTGKTTLAEAICRAASIPSTLSTATDAWTTFETIGSYFQAPRDLNDAGEKIDFMPGLMLDAIVNGRCLIVDELNRADMDKCFGEFFSLATGQAVTLPFRKLTPTGFERIRLMPRPGIVEDDIHAIPVPSWWRLIGAMNDADKGAIRRLSQAFKRRFASVPVPIPPDGVYRAVLERAAAKSAAPSGAPMDQLLDVLRELFATRGGGFDEIGQPLGPAIPLTIIRRAAEEWSMDEMRPIGRVLNSVLANAVAPLLSEIDIDRAAFTKVLLPHVEDPDRLMSAVAMWNNRRR